MILEYRRLGQNEFEERYFAEGYVAIGVPQAHHINLLIGKNVDDLNAGINIHGIITNVQEFFVFGDEETDEENSS